MKIILLNTSILSTQGLFLYELITIQDVKELLAQADSNGTEVLSAIGHNGTAELLTLLLERDVSVNRIHSKQHLDDIGVVFKLNGRPKEGRILTIDEAYNIGFQFGLLTKVATSEDLERGNIWAVIHGFIQKVIDPVTKRLSLQFGK